MPPLSEDRERSFQRARKRRWRDHEQPKARSLGDETTHPLGDVHRELRRPLAAERGRCVVAVTRDVGSLSERAHVLARRVALPDDLEGAASTRSHETSALVVCLDTPFENWTLAAPDLGSILLSVDFTAPVDAIRGALAHACAEHEAWDKKTCSLEVTDATEHTMTLRALVSSSDAAKNWTLRCFVRERLIAFLATLDQGRHLPRDRAGLPGDPMPDAHDARTAFVS